MGLGLRQSHETASQSSTPKATASASAGAACASLMVQEGLKGMSRAVQKIQRGYEGDVSRLLDVCRKRIVFENPRDIVECFKIIVSDRDVVICGITNGYESGYNAKVGQFRPILLCKCHSFQSHAAHTQAPTSIRSAPCARAKFDHSMVQNVTPFMKVSVSFGANWFGFMSRGQILWSRPTVLAN